MNPATIRDLLDLLARLKGARIYYSLSDHTADAVMVEVSVPGEHWEIELHDDGKIGVEVFVTTGRIQDGKALEMICSRGLAIEGPAFRLRGDEKRLVPATTFYGTATLSLSSRPERSAAEGPAVRHSGAPHVQVSGLTESIQA
jgi:hypothetical protein